MNKFIVLTACYLIAVLSTAAHAFTVEKSMIFCMKEKEFTDLSSQYTLKLSGTSGSQADKIGQVWMNENDQYMMVQVVPDQGLFCVLMVGRDFYAPGEPT